MAHGSPRRVNEFLWESTSSDAFLGYLLDEHGSDILFVTHTGIPWRRRLPDDRLVVNVGAIGRPPNDGHTCVPYVLVDMDSEKLDARFIDVHYPHERLAEEMRDEGLPEEFAETIVSGWWTTCLEILPAKERMKGKY